METRIVGTGSKLNQLGSEIHEQKWNNMGGNTTQTTTQNTTQSSVLALSEIEGRIIQLLQSNPTASQGMIAEDLEMDVNNIKYYVNKMKKQGVLE